MPFGETGYHYENDPNSTITEDKTEQKTGVELQEDMPFAKYTDETSSNPNMIFHFTPQMIESTPFPESQESPEPSSDEKEFLTDQILSEENDIIEFNQPDGPGKFHFSQKGIRATFLALSGIFSLIPNEALAKTEKLQDYLKSVSKITYIINFQPSKTLKTIDEKGLTHISCQMPAPEFKKICEKKLIDVFYSDPYNKNADRHWNQEVTALNHKKFKAELNQICPDPEQTKKIISLVAKDRLTKLGDPSSENTTMLINNKPIQDASGNDYINDLSFDLYNISQIDGMKTIWEKSPESYKKIMGLCAEQISDASEDAVLLEHENITNLQINDGEQFSTN